VILGIFSKLTWKMKKNAEYMIAKKVQEHIKKLLVSDVDSEFYHQACVLISNLCISNQVK